MRDNSKVLLLVLFMAAAIAAPTNNTVLHLVSVKVEATVTPTNNMVLHLVSAKVEATVAPTNNKVLHLVSAKAAAMVALSMVSEIYFQAAAVVANRAAKTRTVAVAPIQIRIHLVPVRIIKIGIMVSISKVRALVPVQDHLFWATIINQFILEAQAQYFLMFTVISYSFDHR